MSDIMTIDMRKPYILGVQVSCEGHPQSAEKGNETVRQLNGWDLSQYCGKPILTKV
jgi:hypothetical protein